MKLWQAISNGGHFYIQLSKIRLALGIASDADFCDKCLGEGKKVMSAGLATFPNSVKCHLCESCARETVGAL